MVEQAVIVYFDYRGDDPTPLFEVEEQLEAAISKGDVGEFDGYEMNVKMTDGSLYMYGPNAEALFAVVQPVLTDAECLKNVRVKLRFGPPADGTPERTEILP